MTLLLTFLIATGFSAGRVPAPAPDRIRLVQDRAFRQFQPTNSEPRPNGTDANAPDSSEAERRELREALERFVAEHRGEVVDIRTGTLI